MLRSELSITVKPTFLLCTQPNVRCFFSALEIRRFPSKADDFGEVLPFHVVGSSQLRWVTLRQSPNETSDLQHPRCSCRNEMQTANPQKGKTSHSFSQFLDPHWRLFFFQQLGSSQPHFADLPLSAHKGHESTASLKVGLHSACPPSFRPHICIWNESQDLKCR